MHGRLKVKTTAEQEVEKQKEREKKLALYFAGCQKAIEKRNLKEFDSEALGIIGQLLQNCPDHYTQWNFRKEIILSMISEKCGNEDEIQGLLENELYLTEACLRKNPKSYGAWHHRAWALKKMPKADWKKELHVCGRSLQLDERNFNCWDHRRVVSGLASVDAEDELSFTLKKIQENFSNYSAWHYRSSLLLFVYPGDNSNGPRIDEATLHKEYELVQNAAFTDPSDQSAWFYHRWLLGRAEVKLGLLYCHFDSKTSRIIVIFTKAVQKEMVQKLRVLVKNEAVNCDWLTSEDSDFASTVWHSQVSATENSDFKIKVLFDVESAEEELQCSAFLSTVWKGNCKQSLYSSELSAATTDVLQKELESCQQLLDMEPDNKWTLLTCILLLRALDTVANEQMVFKYFDQLQVLDPMRKNYYKDLKSKCIVENYLTTFLRSPEQSLNLSDKGLTLFCHADHLVYIQRLDLSRNGLTSLQSLRNLISLRELVLDHNLIESCSGLEALTQLQVLNLQNNRIKSVQALNVLQSCPKLCSLQITNNPVVEESSLANEIKALCPSLQSIT